MRLSIPSTLGSGNPLHEGIWYNVEHLPARQAYDQYFDVIVKAWDRTTDEFVYTRWPDCKYCVVDADNHDYSDTGGRYGWRNSRGQEPGGRVVAIMIHPDWTNVQHRARQIAP